MWRLILFSITCLIVISSSLGNLAIAGTSATYQTLGKLPVTIYYEALCGYSIMFFTDQLYPTWQRRGALMDLRLVPFGKAGSKEHPFMPPTYICQHGLRECQLNIFHGCILEKLPFANAFPVVACLMKNYHDLNKCFQGQELSTMESIQECSQGQLGAKLFKQFGTETDNISRPLLFVPTIVGDQPFDYYELDEWLYHFDRKFVQRYEAVFGVKL